MVNNLLLQMTLSMFLNSLKNEIISNGPYVEKFEKKVEIIFKF